MNKFTITPALNPPILNAYSLLSPEAQKTLASIEIKYSNLMRNSKSQIINTHDYYKSIYNATFKKDPEEMKYQDFSSLVTCNRETSANDFSQNRLWESSSYQLQGSNRFKTCKKTQVPTSSKACWFENLSKSPDMPIYEEVNDNGTSPHHEKITHHQTAYHRTHSHLEFQIEKPQCHDSEVSGMVPSEKKLFHMELEDSPVLFASLTEDTENVLEPPKTVELDESPCGSKVSTNDNSNQDKIVEAVDFDLHWSDFEMSQKSQTAPISWSEKKELNNIIEDPLAGINVLDLSSSSQNNQIIVDSESPITITGSATEQPKMKSTANIQNNKLAAKCLGTNNEHLQISKRKLDDIAIELSENIISLENSKKSKKDLTVKEIGRLPLSDKDSTTRDIECIKDKTVKRRKNEFKPPVQVTNKISLKELTVSQPEVITFSTLQSHDQEVLLNKLQTFKSLSLTYIFRENQALINTFNSSDYHYFEADFSESGRNRLALLPNSQPLSLCYVIDCNTDNKNIIKKMLLAIMGSTKILKIISNLKEFLIALQNYLEIDDPQGIICKNCEDPVIAAWMLTPEISPSNISQVYQPAGIKLKECKLIKLEKCIYQAAGHKFCLNSHVQLRQVLFEELKLDQKLPATTKLSVTNAFQLRSTSEATLNILSAFHPLPSMILEYRQLQKLKSTYIDGIKACVVGKTLRSHWSQTAAATGRITSSRPNLQAVPKGAITVSKYQETFVCGSNKESNAEVLAREPYICNAGHVLLAADFQQIELRILAHLSEDSGLLSKFWHTQAQDIFISLTSEWCEKPIEEVTSEERERTKRVVYSIIYGAGKERLSEYLKVSPDVAKEIMNDFLSRFPSMEVFIKKCWSYARDHGYTETICGRRRYFPHINSSSANLRSQAQRQAVNFCVQGSAADICKLAMIKVDERLKQTQNLSCRLLIQIHDELVWEVPDHQLYHVKDVIQQVIEDTKTLCGSFCTLQVPLPVVFSSGKSWAHLQMINSHQNN
uniref:DNA-directed DNA polymerase family A palm domain-containing protein n=1 Tax=Biomphalaria glabrata TaxID=6526 RepID=A0A2C9LMK3_BIOGL